MEKIFDGQLCPGWGKNRVLISLWKMAFETCFDDHTFCPEHGRCCFVYLMRAIWPLGRNWWFLAEKGAGCRVEWQLLLVFMRN